MSDRRFNGITSLVGRVTSGRARWAFIAATATIGLACQQQGIIGERLTGRGTGPGVDPTGGIDPGAGGSAGSTGSTGSGGSAGSDGTTGTGGAGGAGGAGGGPTDGGTTTAILPARIRRLTNAEYDASVNALLGIASNFGGTFTPDARQDGFTRNDAQRVDPVFTMQIDDAATQLATQARSKFSTIAPCANPTGGGEACANSFVASFAPKAYRRPVVQGEIDGLLAVYRAGVEGFAYADGIEALIHAILVSPGFLYTTEIGTAAAPSGGAITITPHEAASALSYLMTGSPPDDMLLADAANGEIMKSAVRQAHTRRLFMSTAASTQMTRMVEEWLGIDRITDTAKDSNAHPAFAGLKDAMKREADEFVKEVMKTTHSMVDLLNADWTKVAVADTNLVTQMYGSSADLTGRVSLTTPAQDKPRRRGILNQGAFLSVYSHAIESGPVLRGVGMIRRLACIDMASPTDLNIMVVPPVPDPTKTTRERFKVHATDPMCASCHSKIDGFGFAFENFDAMGNGRLKENTKDIDSTTTLAVGMDFDGMYADSSALVEKMATSANVRSCFARHLFRGSAANSILANRPVEESFLAAWGALAPDKQADILEVLVAWLGSDTFIQRRAQP